MSIAVLRGQDFGKHPQTGAGRLSDLCKCSDRQIWRAEIHAG